MRGTNGRLRMWIVTSALMLGAGCAESIAGTSPGRADLSLGDAPELAGVHLQVESDRFRGGGPIRLLLLNETEAQIGFNLCLHEVERRRGGEWRTVLDGRICTMELRLLEAGETATYDGTLPEGLGAGTYRIRATIYAMNGDGRRDVASEPFRIRP